MKMNEGSTDRIVRAIGGAIVLAIDYFLAEGPVDVIQGAIVVGIGMFGAYSLVTGLIGWCPVYALLGINTQSRR